jgi:putative endonuclease
MTQKVDYERWGAHSVRERNYAVYIMASGRNGTLYIGVTNNLSLRVHQHRSGIGSTFTSKYGVNILV